MLSTAPFRLREGKEKLGHNAVCFSAQLTSTGKARAELSSLLQPLCCTSVKVLSVVDLKNCYSNKRQPVHTAATRC